MQQVTNIKEIFREYFSRAIIPDRIIELGTAWGTFTHIVYDLRKEINDDFDFITVDHFKTIEDIPDNMTFHLMDIFDNIDFIRGLIIPKTLVLCDNGNKKEEVRLLAPYLKKDCVIMAHDYFYKKEDVGGYWGNCEITWDDVKDLGLIRYQYELMENAAWVSLKTTTNMFCRVVNLDSRPDRMKFISKEMDIIGFTWERFPANNPPGVSNPCIGNAFSHHEALKGVTDWLFVCEDDVTFLENSREIFDRAFAQLPEDWDIFYLGANVKRPAQRYSENLFRVTGGAHCTHAIIYSEKARKFILENYDPLTDEHGVYDHWLFCKGQSLLKCFVCYPVVAYQRPGHSDLRGDYQDYYIEMRSNEIKHLT